MTTSCNGGKLNDFDAIADVYEELVAWAPYHNWVADLQQRLRRHGLRADHRILDAACGTGLSAIPWAERGYDVVGVDRSEPMLRQARRKVAGRNLPVSFVSGDLLALETPGPFGLAVCMHSGLDYILDLRRLARAFGSLRGRLSPGGLLAFDKCLYDSQFHREPYATTRRISCGDATFHYRWDDKLRLFDQRCVIHRTGSGKEPRCTEILHRMRAVEVGRLCKMVEKAGFQTLEPPTPFTVSDPGMGIFRAV